MGEEEGLAEVVPAVVNGTAVPAKVGENLSEKKEDGIEGIDIDSKDKEKEKGMTEIVDVNKGGVKVRHSKKSNKEVKEQEKKVKKVKKVKKDGKETVKEKDVTESDKIEVVSGGEVDERNENKDEKVADSKEKDKDKPEEAELEKVSKKRSRKKSVGEKETAQKKGGEEKKAKEKKEEAKTPVASVLDRPVRQRKSVQRLVAVIDTDTSKEFHIEMGRGTALKDIPNVAYKLSRRKLDETLKMFHTILFGRRGKALQIKNNILQFSGYVWVDNEEKQRLKVREKLDKYTKENLLEFCDLINLQISKATSKKEEIIAKLIEFLESPHATTSELLADREQSSKGKKRGRAGKSTASVSDDSASKAPSKSKRRKISSEEDKKNRKPEGGDETEEEQQQQEEDGEEEEDENVKGSPEKSKDEKPDQKESKEENKSGTGSEEDSKSKKSSKKSSSKKEPAEKPKTKKTLTPKKSNPPPQKSTSSKPSSSSKVLDDTETDPKTLSRKKKYEVGTEQSSATKKPASKEKSSSKGKSALKEKSTSKEKSGKKVVKAKERSKEEKPRPSDDDLRTAVCEILKEVDFNTATFIDILNLLGERFKTDLTPRKASIKLVIQDELTKLAEEADDEEDEEDSEKDKKQPSDQDVKTAWHEHLDEDEP